MLGAKPGERILDLGCGDGALTAEIKASGADVLGVDLSDELLAVARMKGLNVHEVDGHALDFVPSSTRYSPMRRCIGCASRIW